MGIIILPFLFGAFVIGVIAIIKIIKLIKTKIIGMKEILYGLMLTVILFSIISISYIIEGRAWGLSPAFRIPIFMIFIPFIVHIIIENHKKSKIKQLSMTLLTSVGFTTILGIIFNDLFFELIDYLGIEKYY